MATETISADLDIQETPSEIQDSEMTPLEYDISILPADFTLELLYEKWKNKEIIIPEFQRGYVWSSTQTSRLIESFMMGLPIPPIFLYAQSNETYLVIDGSQRLRTIFQFFNDFFDKLPNSGTPKIFKLVVLTPYLHITKKLFLNFRNILKDSLKIEFYVP